ncbi:hypothetical protein C882_0215 [Caenispirillum salinarum AK4]|uniref:HEAT repeat protein n=1 Tax=Caenispirillum salinarum AK4 TaxID=1238182 RepID=K9GUX4_9PROT|nr:HEAT repeat domain-containing protein [Caenispirillum salinarum]EKV29785.1 hypothetical protein C882_0215 [Caenispirillum salinarum AK4]
MLQAIWWTALALAGASLLIMLMLILRRLIVQRGQRRRLQRAEALKARLFDWIERTDDGAAPTAAEAFPVDDRDARILMDQGHRLLNTLRGAAAERIVTLLHAVGAVESECLRLSAGKAAERRTAATALRWFAADDAAVHAALCCAMTEDPDGAVRLAAAQALTDAGRAPDVDAAVSAMWTRQDVPGRGLQDLFRDLAAQAPDQARAALAAAAEARLRVVLIDALGHARAIGAVPDLTAAAVHAAELNERAAALRALAAIGHPRAHDAVAAGLSDPAWEVRAQAALGVMRIGLSDLAPRLPPLLDDPQWWVRFRAAQALAAGGPEGRAALETAAASDGAGRTARVAQLVLAEAAR